MHRLEGALCALLLASVPAAADLQTPASVLVFPCVKGDFLNPGGADFTIVAITNTNLLPITPFNGLGGSTNVRLEFVNATPIPHPLTMPKSALKKRGQPNLLGLPTNFDADPAGQDGAACVISNFIEFLTPADTFVFSATCVDPSGDPGYLVATAQDPSQFDVSWSFNHLIGSQFTVQPNGLVGSLPLQPIGFRSPLDQGDPTDVDGDDSLDFDGIEYEGVHDTLLMDSFVSSPNLSLVLLNLTGGTQFTNVVAFDIWNDNEFPLSATALFQCWASLELRDISLAFDEAFLRNNTPHDPTELDVNCDNLGDFETGWARVRGVVADSGLQTVFDPALLGALVGDGMIDPGRELWGSPERQFNGKFLNFLSVDPELP